MKTPLGFLQSILPGQKSTRDQRHSRLPKPGSVAPDFTLLTDEGVPLTLSSLRGSAVVLFFYPKDNTPVCTRESCEFRDAFPQFQNVNAVVLGISPDSVWKHVHFRAKYALPYRLLADTDHAVAEQYGVWGEKALFGYRYLGVRRTTFLIDERGLVARIFEQVKATGHAAEVLAALASASR